MLKSILRYFHLSPDLEERVADLEIWRDRHESEVEGHVARLARLEHDAMTEIAGLRESTQSLERVVRTAADDVRKALNEWRNDWSDYREVGERKIRVLDARVTDLENRVRMEAD